MGLVAALSTAFLLVGCFEQTASVNPETTRALSVKPDVQNLLISADWEYLEYSSKDIKLAQSKSEWQSIDLPHTWNAFDPTDSKPGYRRAASWYQKSFDIATDDKGLRYILSFEAAQLVADVYVNDQRAGGHIGGYLGFDVDITDYLNKGAKNTVFVRVDNTVDLDLIPSQKADFVIYGGLTRDVSLKVREAVHVERIFIETPVVSAENAETKASVLLVNHQGAQTMNLSVTIRDNADNVVLTSNKNIEVAPGSNSLNFDLPVLKNPSLWHVDSPNLYTAEATLTDATGLDIASHSERFGYRWFEFKAHGAFYLNGERLLLRGTHLHEGEAGVGSALTNEQHWVDMRQIKDVGANFLRLGHYSHDPSVYDAANELGILLWDEVPWNRGGVGGTVWRENTKNHLREMIAQNRNHPSVIIWSLGNEVYWMPDIEGGGEPDVLRDFMGEMNDLSHLLDPSRATATRKFEVGPDLVDVYSPSIWAGWYGGGFGQYGAALDRAQKKYPRFLHAEYGGSSHVGRHTATPFGPNGLEGGQLSVEEMVNQSGVKSVAKGSDWDESYIVDLFDWHLKVSETQPDFVGNAQWAFKDFATPIRPENHLPYINQKGLVTRDGKPKEAYWVFKSYWTTEPFCRIYGHDWTERYTPEGTQSRIRVYCNVDSAELSLNGKSLGRKQRNIENFPASGLYWDVDFKEGHNSLAVTGFSADKITTQDALNLNFTNKKSGKLYEFDLTAKKRVDGLIEISAIAVDAEGVRVLQAKDRVYFSHTNEGVGGELLTAYGTPNKSAILTLANGVAKILFKPNDDVEGAIIEIRSQTNKGTQFKLDKVPDAAVVYKTIGDVSLKLHIYNPKGLKVSDKRPAMVFFHGGGWSGGEASKLFSQAQYLASRGIVGISAEYRVNKRNNSTPRESVMDAKSAMRWVREHASEFGIDPEKILAGGGSAGGHLAAATGTLQGFNESSDNLSISARPEALVLFNPVYDNSEKGYGYKKVKAYWQEISPMHNLSEQTPPTLVMLGSNDRLIPVATAEKYKTLMEAKGVRSDLHIYEGQKHGFFNYSHPEHYQKTVAAMDEFLVSLGYLAAQ
tara:strand:- start:19433 stop:22666 length:3234 start_codon:yes stop_codon:yes gene_type:complete